MVTLEYINYNTINRKMQHMYENIRMNGRGESLLSKVIQKDIDRFCQALETEKLTKFIKEYEAIGEHPIYGGKHAGSDAEHEGAQFIYDRLKDIGVPKIEFIENKTAKYQFNDATLTVVSDMGGVEPMEIKPYGYRSPGTSNEGITAQLVDAGTVTRDEFEKPDAEGRTLDIEGKIALFQGIDGALSIGNILPQIEEAIRHKAAALLIYCTEDILNEDTIRVQTPLNSSPIPIMGISVKHAEYLKSLLEKGDVIANLTVDADYDPVNGVTYNVVGEIPGKLSEEKIIYSAHLDHFFKCLNDNMTACAALLGIAETIMKIGYEPNRTIVFQFNGSHECGLADCKHPYITGAYNVIKAKDDEWKYKAIADINFELVGMKLNTLSSGTSVGNEVNLHKYMEYSPELTGGYNEKAVGLGSEGYYGLSWCDGVCYCTEGIPTYSNDPESEQMAGNSMYIGRDHSQHDNWEIYSEDALRDSIRYYGGFGIYLDSLPYAELDFAEQSKRMHAETEFDSLDEEGLKTGKMRATLRELEEASSALLDKMNGKNEAYMHALDEKNGKMAEAEKKAIFDEARKINLESLKLFDYFQRTIEGVSPGDFLISRSGKYLMNVAQLGEAQEALEKGDALTAKEKLMDVDMAGVSYSFSREIVEKMREQAIGDGYAHKRTWAKGKELKCATHYELMTGLKKKIETGNSDLKAELKLVKKANTREMISFLSELRKEFKAIKKAIKMINELSERI